MKKKSKSYDDAFKLLATQDAEALLLLLGELQPGEQAEITPLERELRISTTLPDQPYRVVSERGERIVHVEAESWWKNVMPNRMADYGTREWMLYQLPVECYVLLLTDRGLPKNPPTMGRIDAGDVQITVHYRIIRLAQIPAKQILKLGREYLLPFVPLMKSTLTDLENGARLIGQIEDEKRCGELSLYFGVFSRLRYNAVELLALVGRNNMSIRELMKESLLYQEIVAEGEAKGEAKGRAVGLVEGAKETLRQFIEWRFPKVKVARKINQIQDVELLRQLLFEASMMKSDTEVRKRIDEAFKSQKAQ